MGKVYPNCCTGLLLPKEATRSGPTSWPLAPPSAPAQQRPGTRGRAPGRWRYGSLKKRSCKDGTCFLFVLFPLKKHVVLRVVCLCFLFWWWLTEFLFVVFVVYLFGLSIHNCVVEVIWPWGITYGSIFWVDEHPCATYFDVHQGFPGFLPTAICLLFLFRWVVADKIMICFCSVVCQFMLRGLRLVIVKLLSFRTKSVGLVLFLAGALLASGVLNNSQQLFISFKKKQTGY